MWISPNEVCEMKRPEKKEVREYDLVDEARGNVMRDFGYNQAIDAYEKFLPTEKEIWLILIELHWCKSNMQDCSFEYCKTYFECKKLVDVIAKRLWAKE